MRRAIAGDFARMVAEPVQVTATIDARLPPDPGPWTIAPVTAGQHEERLHDLSRAADFISGGRTRDEGSTGYFDAKPRTGRKRRAAGLIF